jgi:putative PIN family toxin of toxin-antitoxin system
MRAVIDTNVFVSGLLWSGLPSKIINAWSDGRIRVFLTMEILAEYRRIFDRFRLKLGIPDV